MSHLLRLLIASVLVLMASAALAYWAGSQAAPDEALPAAVMPEFGSAELVVTPVPVAGDNPWEEALLIAAGVAETRETASEQGVTLEATEHVAQAVVSSAPTTTSELTLDTFAGSTTTTVASDAPASEELPSTPPGSPEESTVRAADECAAETPPETCPDGVSGTILAVHDLPELAGIGNFEPHAPGTAPYNFWPECAPTEPAVGRVQLGIATNRPAVSRVEYHPTSLHLLPPPPDGRLAWDPFHPDLDLEILEVTTPDSAEPSWESWVADDTAGFDDPRLWIDHCLELSGLAPGNYVARFSFSDKYDPSITFRYPYFTRFSVPDETGLVRGLVRRHTTVIGYGIDRLYVGATRTPEQRLIVVAHENGNGNSCDTGGDPAQITTRLEGRIDARVIGDEEIPREELTDPEYPYLREHSQSVLTRLDLTEGTNYAVCVYWATTGGPLFEPVEIIEVESIFVATPEAYRPALLLQGFANLFGEVTNGGVFVDRDPQCFGRQVEFEGRFDSERRLSPPAELCSKETNLTDWALDGIPIRTTVNRTGAGGPETRHRLRVNLRCVVTPCPERLSEIALLPLPEVPTERRLCGSGWGSGCSGDSPMRSAGDAIVQIVYEATPGNGATEWSIGDVAAFTDSTPPLPASPRLDVSYVDSVVVREPGGPPTGARLDVTVRADRPVTLSAAIVSDAEGGEFCLQTASGVPGVIPTHTPYRSDTMASTHNFSFENLCLFEGYRVLFEGVDAEGNPVVLFDLELRDWVATTLDMRTPALSLLMGGTLEVTTPSNDDWHFVRIGNLVFTADLAGTDAERRVTSTAPTEVEWLRLYDVRSDAALRGWFVFRPVSGTPFACAVPGAEPLSINNSSSSGTRPGIVVPYVGDDLSDLAMRVEIRQGRSPRSGEAAGLCAAGPVIEVVDLRASVSLADLFSGIELTSESGAVTLRLRAVSWEPR